MIKEVKLFSYRQNLVGICPCPWAMYMYEIVKSLNVIFTIIEQFSADFTWGLLSKGC